MNAVTAVYACYGGVVLSLAHYLSQLSSHVVGRPIRIVLDVLRSTTKLGP